MQEEHLMFRQFAFAVLAVALAATPLLADQHEEPPPPSRPQLVLEPPPGAEPPEDPGEPPADPEAAKGWLSSLFHDMMDEDGDGLVSQEELRAWVAWAHIPFDPYMHEDMMEQGLCGDVEGILVTLDLTLDPVHDPLHDDLAFTIPEGREAGCFIMFDIGFDIETTENEFQIVEEPEPMTTVWHSMDDGPPAFQALVLGPGIYHAQLLESASETGIYRIQFVDYPVGP
jgi:hypothetical protein